MQPKQFEKQVNEQTQQLLLQRQGYKLTIIVHSSHVIHRPLLVFQLCHQESLHQDELLSFPCIPRTRLRIRKEKDRKSLRQSKDTKNKKLFQSVNNNRRIKQTLVVI